MGDQNIKFSVLLIVIIVNSLAIIPVCSQSEKNPQYFQPPDFLMPMGNYGPVNFQVGDELPEIDAKKISDILPAIYIIKPDSIKTQLSFDEINIMTKLLTDKRLIGDGTFYDGLYLTKRAHSESLIKPESRLIVYFMLGDKTPGWTFLRELQPELWKNFDTIVRFFPNGIGAFPDDVIKTYGEPRIRKKYKSFEHVLYGNVDLLYNKDGEYLGAIFFFIHQLAKQ